jgi:hypothetical protein
VEGAMTNIVFTDQDVRLLRTSVEYCLQFGGFEFDLSLESHQRHRDLTNLLNRLKVVEKTGMEKDDAKKIII